MKHIETLKELNHQKDIFEYCSWTLEFIGSGTGRSTFALSDDLVLKVSRNEAGRRQNEVEANAIGDICANIYQHDENYIWCVMERVYPIGMVEFNNLTGTTETDRMTWCEYNAIGLGHFTDEVSKLVEGRYNSMTTTYGWVDKMKTNEFSNQLVNMMVTNDLEAGDLVRVDSWGVTKNNPNKPILFDYGLSHAVWTECYKRHVVKVKYKSEICDWIVVETVDELDKNYVKCWVNGEKVIVDKVVIP